MGCCSSKMDESGSDSGGPSSPQRRAGDDGSGCGGDGHKSIHSVTASPDAYDAETAAIAAGIAHSLAQDEAPPGEAAAARPSSNHALRDEPYLLPPTVFDPQPADVKVDAFVRASVKAKEGKKKKKKKSSSSSSSSSSDNDH